MAVIIKNIKPMAQHRKVQNKSADIEHLAMTIHGVNYGKDEIEAAYAEFAGLIDAIHILS
jgi:hypothetical protein